LNQAAEDSEVAAAEDALYLEALQAWEEASVWHAVELAEENEKMKKNRTNNG
jgi:hypothetical protein